MNLGLMGYGTIGSGVYDVIKSRLKDVSIKKILVKHMKNRSNELFTEKAEDILDDETIEVVIITIDDKTAAYEFSKKCFERGKHVITCNKEMVSEHLPELLEMSKENKVSFKFESTVGAGLPWIKTISEFTKVNNVDEVYGNFNGTSNYILDLMKKDGIEFQEALMKSRILRYQEPDYNDDITGIDSRNKLAITMMLAFNVFVDTKDIPTYGIETIRNLDFGFFERHRLTPKLMSYALLRNGKIAMLVAPTLYKSDKLRANVGENNNLLGFKGDVVGKVEFIGQGAGKFAAANGIVMDLVDIMNDVKTDIPIPVEAKIDETLMSCKFYFSFDQSSYKIERVLLPYVHSIFETQDSFVITTRNIGLDVCIDLLWKIQETGERFFFAVYEDGSTI